VCLDDECNTSSGYQDIYVVVDSIASRFTRSRLSCEKLGSAEEWLEAIQEKYVEFSVPEAAQVVFPMEKACLTRACPTEKDWCEFDPECTVSPYREPSASVKGWAITCFTVVGILLLVAFLYVLHVWQVKQQVQRYTV